jgi:hypothetical protein
MHAMLIGLMPGALVWPAAMIVWGPATRPLFIVISVHLLMALHGTLRIRGGSRQRWLRWGAVLVRADAAHEVDASEARVLIAFVDPQSPLGAALSARKHYRIDRGIARSCSYLFRGIDTLLTPVQPFGVQIRGRHCQPSRTAD